MNDPELPIIKMSSGKHFWAENVHLKDGRGAGLVLMNGRFQGSFISIYVCN